MVTRLRHHPQSDLIWHVSSSRRMRKQIPYFLTLKPHILLKTNVTNSIFQQNGELKKIIKKYTNVNNLENIQIVTNSVLRHIIQFLLTSIVMSSHVQCWLLCMFLKYPLEAILHKS